LHCCIEQGRNTARDRLKRIFSGVLALTALASGKGMKAWPGQQSTESAPLVKPAVDGVLDLFKQRPVVAAGRLSLFAQEESFYSSLVRDPRFAESVGNVVVEFGGEVSRALSIAILPAKTCRITELRKVWTETAGWVPGLRLSVMSTSSLMCAPRT